MQVCIETFMNYGTSSWTALLTWLHNQQDNEINWEKLLGTTSLTNHHQVSDHAGHPFSIEGSTEAQ